ncbi:hypothetical protein [Gloeobacter morelensis]|uniref:hypothetical protein n=1 Tax=Gloeobacter morelensis TaxID=2907343 RepID=UPI001E575E24|nr:hypothetical protein [Gloeobacter morelensis]UFP97195.1 hypothetical protein ISF26_24040 [Gloeobacter morelensis MG652769]
MENRFQEIDTPTPSALDRVLCVLSTVAIGGPLVSGLALGAIGLYVLVSGADPAGFGGPFAVWAAATWSCLMPALFVLNASVWLEMICRPSVFTDNKCRAVACLAIVAAGAWPFLF